MWLEKVFIGTFILTLLIALSLGLVVASEDTTDEMPPSYDSSFRMYPVNQDLSLQQQLDEENDAYLQHLIRKLRREVRSIPSTANSGY